MTCSSAYGAWYNYAAATAGTITGYSNTTNATKDVCSKGWRLPTYSEQAEIVGTSYTSVFNPVAGGNLRNGQINYPNSGHWWSATHSSEDGDNMRYYLYYSNGSNSLNTNGIYGTREFGFYVRCIRSS